MSAKQDLFSVELIIGIVAVILSAAAITAVVFVLVFIR